MTAALSVTGLGKRYGEIVVAEDLSFAVETGTCLGVIGPNGAGKTSVFNMLDGTVRPDAGQVLLDGRDVTRLKQFQRARLGIARAYQIPQPFPMLTVYENVLAAASFGAGQQGQEAADTAMRVLQTTGLDRLGGVLAGGLALLDRKRLELAKALAARPRVLLWRLSLQAAASVGSPRCARVRPHGDRFRRNDSADWSDTGRVR